jgi:hypothetical protein
MSSKLRSGFIGLQLAALWLFGGYQFASAEAGEWRLIQAEGIVRVMLPGAGMLRGRETMTLPQGTVVTTGPEGRAVLARGSQQIDLSADTRLTVAANAEGMVGIHQGAGTAYYQVESRSVPHFRVDTALMAAVVKGTSFRIEAGEGGDALHVIKGLVEVSARDGATAEMVGAGQAARIDRLFPSEVSVIGASASDIAPSGLMVRPISIIQGRDGAGPNRHYAGMQTRPEEAPLRSRPASETTQRDAVAIPASVTGGGNNADQFPPARIEPAKKTPQKTNEPAARSRMTMPPPQVLASLLFLTFSIAIIAVIALMARRSA